MPFKFEEWMNHQYLQQGYLIFRHIIPDTLLNELRREADKARLFAHQINGPQTQRIQPISKFGDKIDLRPFENYVELDEIHLAVTGLLGEGHTPAHLDIMGILVEPQQSPWHCGWHRDGVVEVPPEGRDEVVNSFMNQVWYDLRIYNQVNCALYQDSCTWFVPGSHLRQKDLPGEMQSTGDPGLRNMPDDWTNEKMEQHVFTHCRNMPGAIPVHLEPGDYMIYRNLGWHCGVYLPYQPRATIHDVVSHDATIPWREEWSKVKKAAVARMKTKPE